MHRFCCSYLIGARKCMLEQDVNILSVSSVVVLGSLGLAMVSAIVVAF